MSKPITVRDAEAILAAMKNKDAVLGFVKDMRKGKARVWFPLEDMVPFAEVVATGHLEGVSLKVGIGKPLHAGPRNPQGNPYRKGPRVRTNA